MKISVCIATYERPGLVAVALASLKEQRRKPDEIVISDASRENSADGVVRDFSTMAPEIPCRLVRSERRVLPWQRWWAFSHTSGDIVLFIDDDVTLAPEALSRLEATYREHPEGVAGVGIPMTIPGTVPDAAGGSVPLRLRWLGTDAYPAGAVTPGGLTVALPTPHSGGGIRRVEWLCGGAMSFPRRILEALGPMKNLCALYDQGVGKGEDGVLSHRALRYGDLLAIAEPLAFHPRAEEAQRTANPQDGYRRGLLETWGRAHTLRWLATDRRAWRTAWFRQISLEFGRTIVWLVRGPLQAVRWARLMGDLAGVTRSLLKWNRIPDSP
jgi:GT2 family glycosyltransferase